MASRNGRSGRPNVVIVISDQHRADTMPGARAASVVRTPHLDWLAEQGTSFRRAYCATPVCTPARTSLLSGLYPHAHGMVANHQNRAVTRELQLSPDVRLLADYLKEMGYACGYTGKWHLGTWGDRRGFSDFVTRYGDHDVDGPEQNDALRFCERIGVHLTGKQLGVDRDPDEYDRRIQVGASLLPLAFHPSMRGAEAAAHFIGTMAGDPRPLALVYSCHEPHPAFVSPRPFHRMYAPADMPLPETCREAAGLRLVDARGDRKLGGTPAYTDEDLRAMWAAYYGAVSYVDHLVGTILAALIETDQFDDTLFIFTADHGEMLGSHGLITKGAVLYEELVNVPLLIKPPGGIAGGHETHRLVSHVDLVPTILGWCGVEVPDDLHATDIRALAEGGDAPVRDAVALEYHSGNWGEPPIPLRGWRTEEWKYVESQGGTDELYDVCADPQETRNLVGDAAAGPVRERLRGALHRWLRETGDRWPAIIMPPQILSRTKWPAGRSSSPEGACL